MFGTHKLFVGARHQSNKIIYKKIMDAVPYPSVADNVKGGVTQVLRVYFTRLNFCLTVLGWLLHFHLMFYLC